MLSEDVTLSERAKRDTETSTARQKRTQWKHKKKREANASEGEHNEGKLSAHFGKVFFMARASLRRFHALRARGSAIVSTSPRSFPILPSDERRAPFYSQIKILIKSINIFICLGNKIMTIWLFSPLFYTPWFSGRFMLHE